MLIIGIDPSIQKKHCGFAIWDTDCNELQTVKGIDTYHSIVYLKSYAEDAGAWGGVGVVVEDAGLDKVVFRKGWNNAATIKIAINAGQNAGAARTIIQACEHLGLPCIPIAPSKRQRADSTQLPPKALIMPTKLKVKAFKELTGWEERTNEHGRDAATLVFGMTEKNFETRLKLQG